MKKAYIAPKSGSISLYPENLLLNGSDGNSINRAENYYSDQSQMSHRKGIWDASNFMDSKEEDAER